MIRVSEPPKKWARGQHFRVNDCDFITFSLSQNNVSSDWTDSTLDCPLVAQLGTTASLYGTHGGLSMITGVQIRSARAAVAWSIEQLAQKSGVSGRTIKRYEAFDGLPPSRTSSLMDIKSALEAAGIEFTGTPEDGPGIRLRTSRRPE
jgi:hypothetical protein